MKVRMPRTLLNLNPYSLNDSKKCYNFLVILYITDNIIGLLVITHIVDAEIMTLHISILPAKKLFKSKISVPTSFALYLEVLLVAISKTNYCSFEF